MKNTTNIDPREIEKSVSSYIIKAAHSEKEKIKSDSLIFKEGFFDSMGFIMLISFIEEEFKVQTSDADLVEENFESIKAITDFVIRKIKKSKCVE